MTTTLNNKTVARELGYQQLQYICGRVVNTAADNGTVKIGTLPSGSLIVAIYNRVVTVFAGGTPVLGIGSVAAGGAVPSVGGSGNVVIAMIDTATGSEAVMPLASLTMPFTAATDIYAGTTGASTSGDSIIAVAYILPLS